MGFFDFFKSPPPKRDESLFLELCASGTAEQVEEAIRNGASVYARYPMWDYKLGYPSTEQFGKQLFTPLLMAAKYNRNDGVLEVLIRHGAEVDAKDYHEWTPLLWASWWTVCFGVHPSQVRALAPEDNPLPQIRKRVKILLDAGANVNARDNVGQTALMYAAKAFNGGDAELVSILIDAGADVNAKNNLGYTALMYAAAYTVENGIFEPVAEPLIRAGADVNARDNEGQTALTKALELGCNRELIATLKKFGAE
ncbi:MAG: ankyrin repeat domain-containing protein [Synergistaceae bacterium]|nr:ankyrin repeat domain-containing protein [Synergistaceae bacterium]